MNASSIFATVPKLRKPIPFNQHLACMSWGLHAMSVYLGLRLSRMLGWLEYKVSTCQHSMLRKQIYLSFGCLMPLRLPKTGDDSPYLARDLSIYISSSPKVYHKTWIIPLIFVCGVEPLESKLPHGLVGMECCGHLINQPKAGAQREGRKDEPEVKPTTWFGINGAGKNEKNDWHWKEVYGNKRVGIDWCLFQRSFDIHPWKALLVGFCWLLLIVCTTRDLLNTLQLYILTILWHFCCKWNPSKPPPF